MAGSRFQLADRPHRPSKERHAMQRQPTSIPPRLTWILVLALTLGIPLSACRRKVSAPPPPSTDPASVREDFDVVPVTGPTIVARATERSLTPEPKPATCLGPAAMAKPLGLFKYSSVESIFRDFPGEFLRPDISTLPQGSEFGDAYFQSAMEGDFRQSIMTITWFIGPPTLKTDPNRPEFKGVLTRPELTINQLKTRFMPDPPLEPSQRLNLRGWTAFGFNPPFEKGLHSLTWKENCRWVAIMAVLPASDLVKIAEGLRLDGN